MLNITLHKQIYGKRQINITSKDIHCYSPMTGTIMLMVIIYGKNT